MKYKLTFINLATSFKMLYEEERITIIDAKVVLERQILYLELDRILLDCKSIRLKFPAKQMRHVT